MTARTRRSLALAAFMSTAALIATPAALAQDLEQRVNNLERKLDALLDLMQQQMQANPAAPAQAPQSAAAASPAASAPVAVPESIRMGQLYLDVHTMPMSQADANRAANDASAIPGAPHGVAVGSVTVSPSGRFNYGEFVSDPALAPFANANALVQTVWHGVLRIDKSGPHAFLLSMGKEAGEPGARYCRVSLEIEGKLIVTTLISNAHKIDQVYSTEQGSVSFQPGFYDFSIYMACSRNPSRSHVFERYGATLLMAAPGDRVAKPIPAHLFGIRE